jgi:hypothetical protein
MDSSIITDFSSELQLNFKDNIFEEQLVMQIFSYKKFRKTFNILYN